MCSSCDFFWYISSMALPPPAAGAGGRALVRSARGAAFLAAAGALAFLALATGLGLFSESAMLKSESEYSE